VRLGLAENEITAFILVKVMPVSCKAQAYRSLRELDGITEMYEIMGEFDVLIKAVTQNIEQLRSLINLINSIKGVYSTESFISTRKAK
jgi:DNA-binding Lrp family transcriptional regulator